MTSIVDFDADFQRVVLKLCCTNVKFFMDYGNSMLEESHFDVQVLRLLFRLAKKNILDYEKELDQTALLLAVDDYVISKGLEASVVRDIRDEVKAVFRAYIGSEQFIIDQLTKFGRRQKLLSALTSSAEILENDGEYEKCLKLVDEAVSFGSGVSDGCGFNDLYMLPEKYREKYSPDQLVKTGIYGYDHILGGGMAAGEVHCLTGDTEVLLLGGAQKTIKALADSDQDDFWVLSCSNAGKVVPAKARNVRQTRTTKETIKLTLANGAVLESTSDHEHLLRTNNFLSAEKIDVGDVLMSVTPHILSWKLENSDLIKNDPKVIKKELITYPEEIPVYCMEVPEHHNFAVASGVFTHNCIQAPPKQGKSSLAAYIGSNILSMGKTVFHATLEIKELDVLIKYAARLSNLTYEQINTIELSEYQERIARFRRFEKNLFVQYWTEGTANALNIRAWVSRLRSKHDVKPDIIILDYDDCLVPVGGAQNDMYENAGKIYSDLIGLADYFKCFSGDTEVPLVDGTVRKLRDIKKDEEVYVYSLDNAGNTTVEKAYGTGVIGTEKVMKVTLDNDEEIRCTPDHKFLRRDGEWVEAKDLKENDSLVGKKTMESLNENPEFKNLVTRLKREHESGMRKAFGLLGSAKSREVRDLEHRMKEAWGDPKVKKIEFLGDEEPVYCLNVPKTSNFLLSAGVVVSNCPILTFAQPKRDAWDLPDKGELIQSYHLAHSAKKAHKCFSLSSMNFKSDSDQGVLYGDLFRRGKSNVKIHLQRDLSRCLFLEPEQ